MSYELVFDVIFVLYRIYKKIIVEIFIIKNVIEDFFFLFFFV